MILKLLVPLAVASVAGTFAIPISLRGARTGRALTGETPEDDKDQAAAEPEDAVIAGMDLATQRDVIDSILRDPSSARDVIASALGLESGAVDRLLGAEEGSPCSGLLALCNKYEVKGPFCDFASKCGGIEDISVFFDQAEEASRDDTELFPGLIPTVPALPDDPNFEVKIDLPGGVSIAAGANLEVGEGGGPGLLPAPDFGVTINLPGGVSIATGANLEVGEGGGPGLSIAGEVGVFGSASVDPDENPLGFGVGVGASAGAGGQTGVNGGFGSAGVDLDFDTEGSSAVGITASAELGGDAATYGVSNAKLDGSVGFNAVANPMGAHVGAGVNGSAVAGTFGATDMMGTGVSLLVGVGGAVSSAGDLSIGGPAPTPCSCATQRYFRIALGPPLFFACKRLPCGTLPVNPIGDTAGYVDPAACCPDNKCSILDECNECVCGNLPFYKNCDARCVRFNCTEMIDTAFLVGIFNNDTDGSACCAAAAGGLCFTSFDNCV